MTHDLQAITIFRTRIRVMCWFKVRIGAMILIGNSFRVRIRIKVRILARLTTEKSIACYRYVRNKYRGGIYVI